MRLHVLPVSFNHFWPIHHCPGDFRFRDPCDIEQSNRLPGGAPVIGRFWQGRQKNCATGRKGYAGPFSYADSRRGANAPTAKLGLN